MTAVNDAAEAIAALSRYAASSHLQSEGKGASGYKCSVFHTPISKRIRYVSRVCVCVCVCVCERERETDECVCVCV